MRHQRHTLLVAALALAVIAVVPGGAVAAGSVSVTGDQAADGTVTVTVTENNTTVANATVTVEALNNSSYADVGDHTTDENGTVELAAPEENVTVEVVADANNETASTTTTLTVAANDSEGTLSFGERVSSFVDQLQADGNMSGQQVATFVVSNNPGADNRPDHVDPGPPDDDDEDDERGNGNGADGNNGDDNNGNGDGASGNNGNGGGANNSDNGDDNNGNGNSNGNGNGNGNGNAGAMSGLP